MSVRSSLNFVLPAAHRCSAGVERHAWVGDAGMPEGPWRYGRCQWRQPDRGAGVPGPGRRTRPAGARPVQRPDRCRAAAPGRARAGRAGTGEPRTRRLAGPDGVRAGARLRRDDGAAHPRHRRRHLSTTRRPAGDPGRRPGLPGLADAGTRRHRGDRGRPPGQPGRQAGPGRRPGAAGRIAAAGPGALRPRRARYRARRRRPRPGATHHLGLGGCGALPDPRPGPDHRRRDPDALGDRQPADRQLPATGGVQHPRAGGGLGDAPAAGRRCASDGRRAVAIALDPGCPAPAAGPARLHRRHRREPADRRRTAGVRTSDDGARQPPAGCWSPTSPSQARPAALA